MAGTNDTIDGLLAEFRGYAAGMPPSYHVTMSWAVFRRMLDRLEAAHRRERGDAAKLRDTVKGTQSDIAKCMDILNKIPDSCGYGGLLDDAADELCALRDSLNDALAAPPRNCDVGTAEEQRVRFEAWCEKQPERYCKACAECPTQRYAINCFCKWAQMPYEEGGAK